jgi:Mg2+-importing ATPase
MKMALSGDYGDVFSIMIASIFLPFLPLLPIQMLFQDFIYDFSQIGIPYDDVDEEFLKEPKKSALSSSDIFASQQENDIFEIFT